MPLVTDIQRRQLEIAIAALKVVAEQDDRSGVVDALRAIERLGLGILEDKESKS